MTSIGVVTNKKKVDAASRDALKIALSDAGFADARWYEAKRGSAATDATKSALDDGNDVVLAVGGDGTVRACAHALAGTDVPLAVFPTGTANLFANGFGLPSDPRAVAEASVTHATMRVDLGTCNGVRFGVWGTLTNASEEDFGEGSFDKGIYVSIPFDELMTTSTMRRAELAWAPLTRDGGARLERAYSLFELTEGRNLDLFHNNFRKVID